MAFYSRLSSATTLTRGIFIFLLAACAVLLSLAAALSLILVLLGFLSAEDLSFISAIASGTSIIAVLLAIYQLYQARQTRHVLLGFSESVQTQYVGEFPAYMSELVKMLAAKAAAPDRPREVKIMCDIPGYGHYTSDQEAKEYYAALMRLVARSVPVEVTVYDEPKERQAINKQFSSTEQVPYTPSLDLLLKGYDWSDELGKLIALKQRRKVRQGDDIAGEVITPDRFRDLLFTEYQRQRRDFRNNHVLVKEVRETMPVYFWIVDNTAFFAFAGLRVKPNSVAFKTEDRNLIEIFKSIHHNLDPQEIASAS